MCTSKAPARRETRTKRVESRWRPGDLKCRCQLMSLTNVVEEACEGDIGRSFLNELTNIN